MKKSLRYILGLTFVLLIAVMFLPLFYIAFLVMLFILPPLLFGTYLFGNRRYKYSYTPKERSLQFVSIMIFLPLVLLMITSLLRSVLLAIYSFNPTALFLLNEVHRDIFYKHFIPDYGELFPYWLDLYWGMIGVAILFGMALMDSLRRSMLVRQIEILPTSKVHAAAIGLVELKGKAVPITTGDNEPIILERFEKTGDGMHGTLTITEPFFLDDGTGQIRIDPEGCRVGSIDNAFEINLHHALLKSTTSNRKIPGSRLMPGDDVYVLGNLRIDREHENDSDNLGKVIIKPQKFIFDGFNIYDIFFISNTSEEELLAACKKSITHGWRGVFLTMAIPAWLAINGWTNITQLETLEVEAAPAFFRLITTATTLERQVTVKDRGTHPTTHWLDQLKQDHVKTDEIMKELKEQHLEKLAIPILTKQAMDIDHPAFGIANIWIQKLKVAPDGHWGHEYTNEEYAEQYEKKNNTFVTRVLLDYKKPQLRAYFGEVKSSHLELTKRYVVFELTHKETGKTKLMEFFSKDGWNKVDDAEVFDYILPGDYSFELYAKRQYRNDISDKGSRQHKAIDIKL